MLDTYWVIETDEEDSCVNSANQVWTDCFTQAIEEAVKLSAKTENKLSVACGHGSGTTYVSVQNKEVNWPNNVGAKCISCGNFCEACEPVESKEISMDARLSKEGTNA